MLTDTDLNFIKEHLSFYSSLTEAQTKDLIQSATRRVYKKNDIIYNSSIECLGLIVVVSGVIRSYLLSPEGKEVTLYRLWGGDSCILSASCLLRNIHFDLYMNAQEDTELILIGSDCYARLMESCPEVQTFTQQLTNNRFSDVMWMVEQVFFMSLDQRIAVLLLEECSKNGSNTVHMTHAEIATCIGSAREAVTRMLKYMQEEHLIELFRGGIRILDKKQLLHLTQ